MGREFRRAIYHATKSFPREETFGLANQIRRAACSVTANIAEGYGRFNLLDTAHFCVMALGSLSETLDHLYVALDEGYIRQKTFDPLCEQGRESKRVLNGFLAHLRRKAGDG